MLRTKSHPNATHKVRVTNKLPSFHNIPTISIFTDIGFATDFNRFFQKLGETKFKKLISEIKISQYLAGMYE